MAGFASQSNALFRKNLTFQKRNCKTNLCMVIFPILLCSLMSGLEHFINHELGKLDTLCNSKEVDFSGFCPIPKPQKWTPLLQIPRPNNRAVKANFSLFQDLPDDSCRKTRNCPATMLYTGKNHSLAEALVQNFFPTLLNVNHTDAVDVIPDIVLGTDVGIGTSQFFDGAFSSGSPLYVLQFRCTPNFTSSLQNATVCLEALTLWRNSAATVNTELYQGFPQGNSYKKTDEIAAAYDFLASTEKQYMVDIWYNAVGKDNIFDNAHQLVRVPRSVNLVSNAYLKLLRGNGTKMQFDFVKEMPKGESKITFDLESLIGIMFYVWIVELLFPVMLTYLVYEKQHKLKIMMKMHGLGDGPYWIISYSYFLLMSSVYILLFVIFGSLIGLNFFKMNQYSVQFAFYFIYINLQIALAFLVASLFSNVKTATVVGYIYVFASGILGTSLFTPLMEDTTFPRIWVSAMECFPAFSLYRGMYELSQYSTDAKYSGFGMKWENLNDEENGMEAVMILMGIEWFLLLLIGPFRNCVLCCCQCFTKNPLVSTQKSTSHNQGSNVAFEMEKHDVVRERELVEQIMREPNFYAIVCDNLKKKYPGRDGNPEKIAVKGLSLALPRGECFGMLGPNGAGKTSWINMMIGLTKPTSGTAYVQGMDIRTNMSKIYNSMGVCPQHDLLWETLTGREHLLFYGRLKNLKFGALNRAVKESLKSVNLFYGGIADKQAGKYSGGMKRRLSVAICLIGDPKVVYMDEPSTGLDPASRHHLWNVVKKAKHDRAIVLTTHSMEEAEVLCDRLGIYVDGSLQCIGNPKELKARYGGTYVLTMTTSHEYEAAVQQLAHRLSPKSVKVYHISGTQKFELPKNDVTISEVFQQVENAKKRFSIQAWGIADTTLEDVFIKVARGAEAFNNVLN